MYLGESKTNTGRNNGIKVFMRQKNNFLQSVTLRTKLMASSKNIQQCIFTNLTQIKISFLFE